MRSWRIIRVVWSATISFGLLVMIVSSRSPARTFDRVSQGRNSPTAPANSNNAAVAADLRKAADLLQSGKLDEAEPILRRVLIKTRNNPDAHNLLGIIMDQRGKTSEAERHYRTALQLRPDGVSTMANLGVLLARTNRSDEAIKLFESVLRVAPDHPQATVNLGLQYAARGDDARAIPFLQRAISLGLDSYEVRYRLGISLHNLKRFDQATDSFKSALALSPNAAEPYYYLGLIAWAGGHDPQAADLWDRAVTLRPNFPDANFMLGEALRKNRRTSASVEFYKRALDQDASKFVYYARLGGAYIILGQPDQGLEIFRRGLQRFPNLPQAHYFVGVAARAQANYDLAETELRKSLELESDNVNTLAQLGFVLLERDRITEAEAMLRRSIAISDQHFYANYDLGRLLVKSRRYGEALPILQHAAALKPNNPSVHYQLFMALSRLKRKEEADRELITFKQLEEERKSRPPREEVEVENMDDAPALTRPKPP